MNDSAFKVSTLGMPVALRGYRFEARDGCSLVTEYWEDLRSGRGAPAAKLLGLVFAGIRPAGRAKVDREGMRTALAGLKAAVESVGNGLPSGSE